MDWTWLNNNLTDKALDVSLVVVVFLFSIDKFFSYLKSRNEGGQNKTPEIYSELQKIGDNHLSHIQKCMEEGNRAIIKTMHEDSMQMISILSEIKGILSNK
jgi:hypothetical protein